MPHPWQERPIDKCYLCATPTPGNHVLHAEYITCVLSIIATVRLLFVFPMERTNLYNNSSKLHWAGSSTPAQPTHL